MLNYWLPLLAQHTNGLFKADAVDVSGYTSLNFYHQNNSSFSVRCRSATLLFLFTLSIYCSIYSTGTILIVLVNPAPFFHPVTQIMLSPFLRNCLAFPKLMAI